MTPVWWHGATVLPEPARPITELTATMIRVRLLGGGGGGGLWSDIYSELVYKDHLMDHQNVVLIQVVFIHRFSNMESIPLWTSKMWSLEPGGL